jgi:hypothetical protein
VDRAGCLDGFDQSALGADEIILVATRDEQGEVGRPFVQAETADDAFFREALKQAEDGGLVALLGQSLGFGELSKRHRSFGLKQGGNELFESFRSPHAEFPAAINGFRDDRVHGLGKV